MIKNCKLSVENISIYMSIEVRTKNNIMTIPARKYRLTVDLKIKNLNIWIEPHTVFIKAQFGHWVSIFYLAN